MVLASEAFNQIKRSIDGFIISYALDFEAMQNDWNAIIREAKANRVEGGEPYSSKTVDEFRNTLAALLDTLTRLETIVVQFNNDVSQNRAALQHFIQVSFTDKGPTAH